MLKRTNHEHKESSSHSFDGKDAMPCGVKCEMYIPHDRSTAMARRPMHFQMFFNVRKKIQIEDRKCHCAVLILYYSVFGGIMCASRYRSFTRELLDA